MPFIIVFLFSSLALGADNALENYLIKKGVIDARDYSDYLSDKKDKEKVNISGSVTFRYYYLDNDAFTLPRNRVLFQVKSEFSKKISKNSEVFFGLASGDKLNPRSNFENASGNFSNKNISLSMAGVSYGNTETIKLTAGKIKNSHWKSNSYLWDTDINPEGAQLEMSRGLLSFNLGVFLINETASSKKDAYYTLSQIKFSNKSKDLNMAVTYYDFAYIKGSSTSSVSGRPSGYLLSNSSSLGVYKYDYDVFNLDISYKMKIYGRYSSDLYGSYAFNSAVSSKKQAYIYGSDISFKDKRDISHSLGFNYRRIESDSWLDSYPDVAVFGGSTGIKSLRIHSYLRPSKTLCVYLAYINSMPIGHEKQNEKILLADFIVPF